MHNLRVTCVDVCQGSRNVPTTRNTYHVTHRLEISFGYAKHYLDVFRLMSNLQVTCVDVCRRPRSVPTTYGQRMPEYAERASHTLAYVEKFSTC